VFGRKFAQMQIFMQRRRWIALCPNTIFFCFFYRDVKMGMHLSEESSWLSGKIIPLSLPENR